MDGSEDDFTWPPPVPAGAGGRRRAAGRGDGHGLRGPRWIVSLRALIVVLAMIAAALGMLWLEAAGVAGVSAELAGKDAVKVAVPPLGGEPPGGQVTGVETASAPPAGAAVPGTGEPPAVILVHVAGAVTSPGVFTLEPGSRVYQAVEAAGGALPTAQLAALNLAAPVSDGLQILVPTVEEAAQLPVQPGSAGQPPGQVPGTGAGPGGTAANSTGTININTATAAELDTLPGVGPVLAERIIAWRNEHGPYPSVDALDAVSGIGAKMLENIRALVSVS